MCFFEKSSISSGGFFTVDGDLWTPGSGLMVFVDGKQKNS